jgi:hypothetical protein
MKKLLFVFLLCLGTLSVSAQDDSLNDVRIVANSEFSCGQAIVADGYYAPADPAAPAAAQHEWTLTPCSDDGAPSGDPFFHDVFSGAPSGNDFVFPRSEELTCEQHYRIDLRVTTTTGTVYSTYTTAFVTSTSSGCVSGGTNYYSIAPGGNAPSGTLTLSLTPGSYFYTLSTTGNANLILNFAVSFNFVGTAANTVFQANSNTPFNYSLLLNPAAQLCDAEGIIVTFHDVFSGLAICSYKIDVKCTIPTKQTITCMPNGACYGVYYKGDDDLIHRMYWSNNQWNYQAITPWGGWGSVRVAGWLSMDNGLNKIFFKGTDGNLYNLMLYAGTYPAVATSLLSGISSVANLKSDLQYRTDDCVYIGTDNKIHRVYWANNTWNYQAINPLGGWGNVTAAGGLTLAAGLASQNIFFRSSTGALYNLFTFSHNGTWGLAQITTNNATIAGNGDMVFEDSQVRLYYRGTDNNIHNVSWTASTNWVYDAMTSANGQVPVANSLAKNPLEDRVFFKGNDGRVYAIYILNGQWRIDWLNNYYTNVFGDLVAVGNDILYVSKSKEIGNYYFNGTYMWPAAPLMTSPANAIGCSTYYRLGDPTEETQESGDNIAASTINTNMFDVFPNPSNGMFRIKFHESAIDAQAELFNMQGERVDAFIFSGESYNYSPSVNLSAGLYLLRIMNNGVLSTQRIVVQ